MAEKKTEAKTSATNAAPTKKTSETNVDKKAIADVVAKHSNPTGRKRSAIAEEVPVKKAPKSKDAKVAAVVEKHSASRGKKTTVVNDLKARKTEERYVAIQDAPAADAASSVLSRKQFVLMWILVGVLIAALVAGVVLSVVSGVAGSAAPYTYSYKSMQQVGWYTEQLGTVERVKPVAEMKNGGLPAYPVYGRNLNSVLGSSAEQIAARRALIAESSYLTATGTWNGGAGQYTWMDKDGKLYRGTTANPEPAMDGAGSHRQLYKHTASVGMYGGDVSDDEPGVIKKVTMRPRGYTRGYNVTGVYAPAGEVIKIEISVEDMEATGGIVIHIGQALYNGKANNIWTEKNQMQRFPIILNTMTVDKNTSTFDEERGVYVAYVGSFVGGPIYIRNESVTFSATISGAVNYSHFILGYTTPEEFEQNSKSSAPYFDLEVWSYGVLHSGPKSQAAKYTYDDLYKVAVLWEKVALVSTTNSLQGIVFLYDPFVAAGAAVAFPGQGSVNCPTGWMKDALNYKGIVNQGSWGNFHEYHHNFQGYGVGEGGEVTNNGMSLVSYALFTKISSARGMSNYGGANLGGWNLYTSATWALDQTMRISRDGVSPSNGNKGLALYATLLHNFGADNYIQAKVRQQKTGAYGENYAGYMRAWQDVTHYNMSYYFNDMLGAGLGNQYDNPEYPMFVPVSSVYQTGRGVTKDNSTEYFQTMQPFVITYGEEFIIDLRKYDAPNGQYAGGSIMLPDGFSFTVKSVSQPENGGKITEVKDENGNSTGLYSYVPNKKELNSGKIIVTLGITKDDSAFEVKDVELVLGFEQTHEKNKTVLDREIYTFDASKMYTDAEQAFNSNFKGYSNVETVKHSNPTQNCNTDVWFVTDNDAGHERFPNALDFQVAKDNTITVISGKLYADEEGRYRIYLRGRLNCAVFYSLDEGKTYALGAKIADEAVPKNSAMFRPDDENTYFDLDLEAKSWVYFKEVLITQNATTSGTSYIGLGMKQWTKPMFTMREETDDKGNTVTKYYNYLGVEVSEAEANNAQIMAPTISSTSQPYVNAYRSDYELVNAEFTSDYFYTRSYAYNYADNELQSSEQTLVSTNYAANKSWSYNSFKTEYLTDGNKNTFIHTKDGWGASDKKPLQMVIDLGEVKSVNRMIIYTQYRPNGDYHSPKDFMLEGSVDGETYTVIGNFTDMKRNNLTVTADFDETSLRYYRLTVTGSHGGLIIIGEIEMWRVFEVKGAKMLSPMDESLSYFGKWRAEKVLSDFGQVAVGSSRGSIKFEFEGTRLGVLSSSKLGTKFEVFIDGHKVSSIPQVKSLSEQKGEYGLAFLSDVLTEGKHSVVIKCQGEANFDAFVIYP